jgi:hypothetical protein
MGLSRWRRRRRRLHRRVHGVNPWSVAITRRWGRYACMAGRSRNGQHDHHTIGDRAPSSACPREQSDPLEAIRSTLQTRDEVSQSPPQSVRAASSARRKDVLKMPIFDVQAKHRQTDGSYLCPACSTALPSDPLEPKTCAHCGATIRWAHKGEASDVPAQPKAPAPPKKV